MTNVISKLGNNFYAEQNQTKNFLRNTAQSPKTMINDLRFNTIMKKICDNHISNINFIVYAEKTWLVHNFSSKTIIWTYFLKNRIKHNSNSKCSNSTRN